MSYEKLSEEEIKEVFRKLNINIGFEEEDTNFEVWQVPPIKKGSGSFVKHLFKEVNLTLLIFSYFAYLNYLSFLF